MKNGKEDCVYYIERIYGKNKQIECRGYNTVDCLTGECGRYKTREDVLLDEKTKKAISFAKFTGYQLCNRDCTYWDSRKCECEILRAPYCAIEKCGFYKREEKLIYWVPVERTKTGWMVVGESDEIRKVR